MARKNESGWIYVLSNPCFPYYKVGSTKNHVQNRCDQLSRSVAIPKPFKVEFAAFTKDCDAIERKFHRHMESWNMGKEFYNAPIALIEHVIINVYKCTEKEEYLKNLRLQMAEESRRQPNAY